MKVLSLISTKGGAGKTTVAANLGGLLADFGLRVLLLDLDSQPTLSSYYALATTCESGSYELICQKFSSTEQVITHTKIPRLSLIASNDRAGHMSTLLLHAADGRLRLRNLLPIFEENYDVLIVDTQGARSVVVEMAILASDCAVCPVPPEMLAARELRRGTLELLDELKPYRSLGVPLPTVKLLLNQVNANRRDTRLIMESLRESFKTDPLVSVCSTVIPDRVAYLNAASLGLPVHRVESAVPGHSRNRCAAEIMHALAIELLPDWADHLRSLVRPNSKKITAGSSRLTHRS
ncbi:MULTISPECIES: ParA family protein [unclassified Pseudomonas]|uniref:ParA family protein n=1 Tax=unclassified Pseudomonas TaxID=196821 RepID=UPI000D80D2BC|nr:MULTISPECIES: ParA family protein [unclassified Pseudomonas]PYG78487.1 chromosome partitioning related protein ParA [Pseudomonas sp. RV120224-01c]PYG82571.1 chromosome partitioning related protein ParA [Pseudomonas sp. RV120224-01b]